MRPYQIMTESDHLFQIADYKSRFHSQPTIVGVHGLTGNYSSLRYFAEYFNQRGFRVVLLDLRGRGLSSPAAQPSSVARHAEDVAEIIKYLAILEPILLGHGMGAYISLLVAQQLPVKQLVLLDGGPVPLDQGAAGILTAYEWVDAQTVREDWDSLLVFEQAQMDFFVEAPVFVVMPAADRLDSRSAGGGMGTHFSRRIMAPAGIQTATTAANSQELVAARQSDVYAAIHTFLLDDN